MKKTTTMSTVVIMCLVLACVLYFAYLVNRSEKISDTATLTKVEQLLSRDLELDYPSTVKEVVRCFNEIVKCTYNEDCTEEELELLATQMRKLFDQELLDNNPWSQHVARLKTETYASREAGRRMTSATTAASTDVDYYEVDGFSFARISFAYSTVEGRTTRHSNQVCLLRKDDQGRWKIYGWDLAENLSINRQ